MKRRTFNLALCGIISALGVTVLMLTLIVPIATYACSAFAGMLITVLVIECNKKWAISSFIVVSIISAIIVPDKEAVVFYILLFGYYPIVKEIIEGSVGNMFLQLVTKVANFVASAVVSYLVSIYILGIPTDEFDLFGLHLPLVLLFVGIIVFVMFDYAFTGLITNYVEKYRHKLIGKIKILD